LRFGITEAAVPSLTIKNLPEPLYERLKQEAQRHRRSLNSEVIARLEQVLLTTRIDPDRFLEDLAGLQRRLSVSTPLNQEILDAAKRAGRP
jgi:plasmid stability protein